MSQVRQIQQFRVQIRRNIGLAVKPEAEQIDGNVYGFRHGWAMDDDDPYPGENAWIADDDGYPSDAPFWIASGDLVPVKCLGTEVER